MSQLELWWSLCAQSPEPEVWTEQNSIESNYINCVLLSKLKLFLLNPQQGVVKMLKRRKEVKNITKYKIAILEHLILFLTIKLKDKSIQT